MGLDMMIYGCINDSAPVEELAYWRKHPNLHGYIVNTFAGGVDECQKIDLDLESLHKIIDAVNLGKLTTTTGFFFGTSSPGYDASTIKDLLNVTAWLEEHPEGKIFYNASW